MNIQLYCEYHMANHEFKPRDIERIVYALTGGVRDEGDLRNEAPPLEPSALCPESVLRQSNDPEVYLEYTDSMRNSRIAKDDRGFRCSPRI